MSYPSGRAISMSYDGAGRISQVQKTAPGSVAPYYTVSSGAYAPHGPVTSAQLGNGLWETTGFNDRLQGIDMKLGTSTGGAERWRLQNVFDSTQNNGNIKQQIIDIPGMSTITQAYQYDGVNRLLIAGENPSNVSSPACPDTASQWCRGFSYDQFGNRMIAQRTGQGASLQEPPGFDTSTNHVTGAGWTHDTYHRGTVTSDSIGNYTYDAENRMATANGMNFAYDGNGLRVMKGVPNGPTTSYVYDAFGALAAEYSVGVPVPSTGTLYLTQDHLGSTRVVTTSSGLPAERHDFLPFGEEILVSSGNPRSGVAGYSPSSSQTVLFTGVERDSNSDGSPTGLDHFWARHLSTNGGRWMSPDPAQLAAVDPAFPQTWNLYSYVLNNPLVFGDPTGLHCAYLDDEGINISEVDHNSSAGECTGSGGYWLSGDVNYMNVRDDGSYQFGYFGTDANGNFTATSYNNYLGPNSLDPSPASLPAGLWNRYGDRINAVATVIGYNQNDPRPSCFGIFSGTVAHDLFPFLPALSDAVQAGAQAGSAYYRNQAVEWAVSQGSRRAVRNAYKKKAYTSLMARSATLAKAAPWFAFITAELDGLNTERTAMDSGACH